ncbi:MAG: hypothetical protein MUC63_01185 [Planctomycetes bacterium]|nr:hypothetical protein [Planctomycetota bacterium]
MRKTILGVTVAALLVAALAAGLSYARDPQWSGLSAVAASPDGKLVAVGGQNRVLYVLDGATLEVKQRIWTNSRVGTLAFNKDGSRLVLEDDEETARIYDTKEWKVVAQVAKAGALSAAPAADLMAVLEEDWEKPKVVFLSLTDGSRKGFAQVPEVSVAFALDGEGKKLAVLTSGKEEGEKKLEEDQKPKDIEGLKEKEWYQKNNGETSQLLLFEVPSGKPLGSFKLWFTTYSSNAEIVVAGDFVYVLTYDNACAKIDAKGEITLFETANSYNYGRGVSVDRKVFLTGGLRDATYTVVDGLKQIKFDVDALPGWPEYFEGFTALPDGTAYAVTSSFRLVKINKDGQVEKTVAVY